MKAPIRQASEIDILSVFVDEMESRGESHKSVMMPIEDQFAAHVSERVGAEVTLEAAQALVDRCFAHEWLKHKAMNGKYGAIGITATDVGVVRSKRRQEQLRAERSKLKVASDFIEDHKGLLIALGAVIALASLILRLYTL